MKGKGNIQEIHFLQLSVWMLKPNSSKTFITSFLMISIFLPLLFPWSISRSSLCNPIFSSIKNSLTFESKLMLTNSQNLSTIMAANDNISSDLFTSPYPYKFSLWYNADLERCLMIFIWSSEKLVCALATAM